MVRRIALYAGPLAALAVFLLLQWRGASADVAWTAEIGRASCRERVCLYV